MLTGGNRGLRRTIRAAINVTFFCTDSAPPIRHEQELAWKTLEGISKAK